MAKGIIVLDDIPKRCADCPIELYEANQYGDMYSFECPFEYKGYTSYVRETKRLDSCPIKLIPTRKSCSMKDCVDIGEFFNRVGFNNCLDEIEGKM